MNTRKDILLGLAERARVSFDVRVQASFCLCLGKTLKTLVILGCGTKKKKRMVGPEKERG